VAPLTGWLGLADLAGYFRIAVQASGMVCLHIRLARLFTLLCLHHKVGPGEGGSLLSNTVCRLCPACIGPLPQLQHNDRFETDAAWENPTV